MRHSAEYTAFTKVVDAVMSVSREEMKRREEEYKRRSDANPKKRGPKRKAVKPPSAFPGPAVPPLD
jgi:hypothetical protein